MTAVLPKSKPIVYPDSDGLPMAENTLQFRWIVLVKENLEDVFANDPNVFVAGDLFWYPIEGDPKTRVAPDVLVALGRPKGERGSYKQWEEAGIAPQVVWEILSPGNRTLEMLNKYQFYERFGVEEYYVYDPDTGVLTGWTRQDDALTPIAELDGWISPLLKIRFQFVDGELKLFRPDDQPFVSLIEMRSQRDQLRHEANEARRLADAQAAEIANLKKLLRAQGVDPEQ